MTATPSKTSCASAASSPDGIGGGPFYSFRDALSLSGMEVTLFHTPGERKLLLFLDGYFMVNFMFLTAYSHGVQLTRKRDDRVLLTLNARSEHDRYKFVMDLQVRKS